MKTKISLIPGLVILAIAASFTLVDISTCVRLYILLLPAVMYRQTIGTLIGSWTHLSVLIVFKYCIATMYRGMPNPSDYFLEYLRLTGAFDILITSIYFICCYVYILDRSIKECKNAKSVAGLSSKERVYLRNYMYISVIANIAFCITGIWDYSLNEHWFVILLWVVMFFGAYLVFHNVQSKMYVKAYLRLNGNGKSE